MAKCYPTTPGNEGYIKNMEVIGFHDLKNMPAFQMALSKTPEGKYYLYCSCFKHNYYNILDVTDPANPVMVNSIPAPNVTKEEEPNTIVLKIQVCDGKMIGVTCGGIPIMHGGVNGLIDPVNNKVHTSVQVFDIAEDPINPKFLGEWTEDRAHRFCYEGGRYVHLSATCEGYIRSIYRIIDIEDPTNIKEVGRWWLPEQWVAGQMPQPRIVDDSGIPARTKNGHEYGGPFNDLPSLHGSPYVLDNMVYMGYQGGWFIIVDITDIKVPKLVGKLTLQPPFAGDLAGARVHTALPLNKRNYAVVTNEGERYSIFDKEIIGNRAQPLNNLHMIDIRDPSRPTLIAEFPYPEVPEDFPFLNFNDMGIGAAGPFGPHNLHEPMANKPWLEDDPNRVYCCYFHAGMRVYDVSDAHRPREIAYFIPPNPSEAKFEVDMPGPLLGTAEDCVVDDRGNIFMSTYHDGLYILRCNV